MRGIGLSESIVVWSYSSITRKRIKTSIRIVSNIPSGITLLFFLPSIPPFVIFTLSFLLLWSHWTRETKVYGVRGKELCVRVIRILIFSHEIVIDIFLCLYHFFLLSIDSMSIVF